MSQVAKLKRVPSTRVEINLGTDEHRVTCAAIIALARHPDVYQRGGILVHIVTDHLLNKGEHESDRLPRIIHLPPARLREMLAEQCDFKRYNDRSDEWVSAHPPGWLVEEIAARGQWEGIRKLTSVTVTPVLRFDGTVVEVPGYDVSSGVLFMPQRTFPAMPECPNKERAQSALAYLKDVFFDFKFALPEHQSCVLAGILTPLARQALRGHCCPLVLIDKNVRGAGGSLLADAISIAATGRAMPRMVQAKDDDEERKRIFAIGLAGTPMVLIDNISRPLGSAALDAALTGAEMGDRLLGKSENVTVTLDACWYATGNNVQILGDTVRRILPVRIESPAENPEERAGFKHDPLKEHVQNIHPKLVIAALTVLRAFVLAGRPKEELSNWGSFEGWSDLIRAALVWAGEPDPAKARQQLAAEADTEANSLRLLLDNWSHVDGTGTGLTAARLLALVAEADPQDEPVQRVKDALMELAPTAFGKGGNAVSLGKRLKHFKGRVVGGFQLDVRQRPQGNIISKRPAGSVEG